MFTNNTAPYGNNIASYPIRIVSRDSSFGQIVLNDIASGQEISGSIQLLLVDYDNQTTSYLSKGSVTISPLNQTTKVEGLNSESIINGVSTFSGIIFVGQPGYSNSPFSVNTNLIDKSVILRQFGKVD